MGQINYDSDYEVRLATLSAMGGDTTVPYDSVYSIDLAILDIIQHGGGGAAIDDNNVSTGTAWSSSKIVSELADAGFDVEIVTELPSTGDAHTIYFMENEDPSTGNTYDEYMYIGGDWELIGSTGIDLSGYATLDDISTFITADALNGYATETFVNSSLNNYYTKADASSLFNPKHSVSQSTSGYKFPTWNANGQITGQEGQAYQASLVINGDTAKTLYTTATGNIAGFYAPTSAGTQGQYLVSNGTGAPVWQNLEVASDYVVSDADASAGTYSTDIAAFYNKTISKNVVQGVQIKIVDEHVVDNTSVYSDSYYLPSSSRIYQGNVELWLMSTEDGQTWENRHYLITDQAVSRDISTGHFGA